MRVLLDICVLSELRRPKEHPGVRRVVEALESDSLFGVVSIGEIAKGIALLKETERRSRAKQPSMPVDRNFPIP